MLADYFRRYFNGNWIGWPCRRDIFPNTIRLILLLLLFALANIKLHLEIDGPKIILYTCNFRNEMFGSANNNAIIAHAHAVHTMATSAMRKAARVGRTEERRAQLQYVCLIVTPSVTCARVCAQSLRIYERLLARAFFSVFVVVVGRRPPSTNICTRHWLAILLLWFVWLASE